MLAVQGPEALAKLEAVLGVDTVAAIRALPDAELAAIVGRNEEVGKRIAHAQARNVTVEIGQAQDGTSVSGLEGSDWGRGPIVHGAAQCGLDPPQGPAGVVRHQTRTQAVAMNRAAVNGRLNYKDS